MHPEKSEPFWQNAAKGLAWRINLVWWLERWTGGILAVALGGALALLLGRWFGVALHWIWAGVMGAWAGGAVLAWWLERQRFESVETARIRLEDALGLNSRLSAAAAGVGTWPAACEGWRWPVSWRWQRLAGVLLMAGMLPGLAVWIPVKTREPAARRIIEKPSSLKEVEEWLAEVRDKEAVEEKSVEEMEKKVEELLKRPAENWYEHGSLEAAGHLKEQTAQMLQALSQNLADAERSARVLQSAGAGLPKAAKEALERQLLEAAKEMMADGLKPNEQLMEHLKKMGAEALKNMSAEQRQQLAEQLRQNAEALQEALKNAPQLELAACDKPGEREGPGRGGITRGPGEAPFSMEREETHLDTKKVASLPTQLDVQRAAPGDLLGTSDGKHEVDKTSAGPQAGGVVQDLGDGGAAVWRHELMPAERETLRRYFK